MEPTNDVNEKEEVVKVSETMERFGKFQVLQFLYMTLAIMFVQMNNINYVFVAGNINYRCKISECDDEDPEISPPWWPNTTGKCSMPIIRDSGQQGNCTLDSFTNTVKTCQSWVYENNNTIVADLNLACDQWRASLVGTIHSFGLMVGLFVAGIVCDRIGRKPVLVIGSLGCVIGVFRIFTTSYKIYIALEFFQACVAAGVFSACGVLMIEIIGKKNRPLAGVIFAYAIYMGEATFAFIAMMLPNWKDILCIICTPPILCISYVYLIRESPRWQILNGKTEQAKETFKMIARLNKANINVKELTDADDSNIKKMFNIMEYTKKEGYSDVFKSKQILLRLAVAFVSRFTVGFVYDGLTVNSVWLPGNKYTNFMMATVMSFPGELISMYLMNKYGRKYPLCCGYLICGAVCVGYGYVSEDNKWLKIGLFLVGKLIVSVCYTGVVIYSMELFPTSVRASLLAICTLASTSGSMLSPLTPMLATVSPILPPICFACTTLLAGILLTLTPETKGLPLLDTIQQIKSSSQTNKKSQFNEFGDNTKNEVQHNSNATHERV